MVGVTTGYGCVVLLAVSCVILAVMLWLLPTYALKQLLPAKRHGLGYTVDARHPGLLLEGVKREPALLPLGTGCGSEAAVRHHQTQGRAWSSIVSC